MLLYIFSKSALPIFLGLLDLYRAVRQGTIIPAAAVLDV